MIDIQSVTAEIRRGKKEERKLRNIETTGVKYNGLPITMGGHNEDNTSETKCKVVIRNGHVYIL